MPNIAIQAALLICSALFSATVTANIEDPVRAYIQHNFPTDFAISTAQLRQMQQSIINPNGRTLDFDQYVAEQAVHIELQRAITRLYCLQLLRSGTQQAYQQFIQAQLQAKVANPLSFATFNKLAKHLQRLNTHQYALLHDASAEKLAHFRHMLYTEGGVGMFKQLRNMILHGYINAAEIDLWYAGWIINISGFRGHVDPRGSLYLTESVAQDMQKLQDLLYQMLDAPNYDPLIPYLEYRAQSLGLQNLAVADRLFIAHLGGILRLYTAADGQRLYTSVMQLPIADRAAAQQYFLTGLQDPMQQGPTYVPALFGNALAVSDGNIELVIKKILPIYNQILQEYNSKHSGVILSFNELSAMKNVKALLLRKNHEETHFIFKADGSVIIKNPM